MHKLLQKYMRCKKYRNYLRIAKNSAKYRNVCANICKNIRSAKQKYKYLRGKKRKTYGSILRCNLQLASTHKVASTHKY